MFIPKKDRKAILTHVFREGCVAAKVDYTQPKHQQIATPTIYVVKIMKGLCSKKLCKRTYSWGWVYWTLNDKGIEYVRDQLHLPAETMPNTFRKLEAQKLPESFQQRSASALGRGRGGNRTFGTRDNKDFKPRTDGDRPSRGRGGASRGRGGSRPAREDRPARETQA